MGMSLRDTIRLIWVKSSHLQHPIAQTPGMDFLINVSMILKDSNETSVEAKWLISRGFSANYFP